MQTHVAKVVNIPDQIKSRVERGGGRGIEKERGRERKSGGGYLCIIYYL